MKTGHYAALTPREKMILTQIGFRHDGIQLTVPLLAFVDERLLIKRLDYWIKISDARRKQRKELKLIRHKLIHACPKCGSFLCDYVCQEDL